MAEHVSARIYDSLGNICFLVARDHGPIGTRVPRSYLEEYEKAGRKQPQRVMKSHLIPIAAESGVSDRRVVKSFKKSRQRRLALICAAFEKEVGMKLFRWS